MRAFSIIEKPAGVFFCYAKMVFVFQINKALAFERSKRQWVDLGIHTGVCMAQPNTCGAAGGAISLWIKLLDCPNDSGIISSFVATNTSTVIFCRDDAIK